MTSSLIAVLFAASVLLIPTVSQGEAGLASGYPGDAGIGADPSVLLAVDYESDDWKDGWDCSNWDYYGVTDSLAFQGGRSLIKQVPAGTNGASLTYDLDTPVDVMYHRVYARFASGTPSTRVIGISGVGEGLPQWKAMGSAGQPPDGTDYFCATLCTDYDDPFASLWYPYHMDQKGKWGDNWPVEGRFPKDRWFHLEIMVKMNTPNEPDGELRMWVEGKEVFTRTDLRWRATEKVAIGRVIDQVYASKPFPKPGTFLMDNRVVATKYVGPYREP